VKKIQDPLREIGSTNFWLRHYSLSIKVYTFILPNEALNISQTQQNKNLTNFYKTFQKCECNSQLACITESHNPVNLFASDCSFIIHHTTIFDCSLNNNKFIYSNQIFTACGTSWISYANWSNKKYPFSHSIW